MKKCGIYRKIDRLGRVTLPIDIRRSLDLKECDEVEIYLEDNKIILDKKSDIKVSENLKNIALHLDTLNYLSKNYDFNKSDIEILRKLSIKAEEMGV